MAIENVLPRQVLYWGADQELEFDFDPKYGSLPADVASYTLQGRFGPDDATETYWAHPAVTPTVNAAGKIRVPVTKAESELFLTNINKVRLGVWRIDAGNNYPVLDALVDLVHVRGRV